MIDRILHTALILSAAAPAFAEERSLPLEKVKVEKGDYILVEELGGTLGLIGRRPYAVEVDGRELVFFDLDRNGSLDGRDGFAMAGHPFVVPLPEELLLAGGQYAYRFEGTRRIVLRRSELGLDAECFPTAVALTEVRVRAGLRPLVIDARLSDDARKHLDYLEENGVVGRHLTLDAHDEHPRRPGYSEEGARAGRIGILGNSESLTSDVMAWYASVFHGARLLDPTVTHAGLARRHGISLLYPRAGEDEPREVRVHPPDGARHVPPNFSRGGEVPSPVPDRRLGAGTGFPISIWLPPAERNKRVLALTMHDSAGVEVKGYVSSPIEPASKHFPRNMGCAFFIPGTRLEDGETYTVSFRLEGGVAKRWSFRTWQWEPRR